MAEKCIVEWGKPNFNNVAGLFVLKPGVNEVESALVDRAMEIKLFRWYVEEGIVKLRRTSLPTLAKMKPADAVELVKKTVDGELLERWATGEKRRPVLEAIEKQIDLITLPTAPAKGAEGAEGAEA